jgi:hypothetical protein
MIHIIFLINQRKFFFKFNIIILVLDLYFTRENKDTKI